MTQIPLSKVKRFISDRTVNNSVGQLKKKHVLLFLELHQLQLFVVASTNITEFQTTPNCHTLGAGWADGQKV